MASSSKHAKAFFDYVIELRDALSQSQAVSDFTLHGIYYYVERSWRMLTFPSRRHDLTAASKRMAEHRNHPLRSALGVFALTLWLFYSLYAAVNYPDILTSVLIGALFGFAACLALVFNFKYWRSTVMLASSVYLLLYVIRIVRMTTIRLDLSFFSALSFYYRASWQVAAGAFEEKGLLGGLTYAYLEYVMPVLVVILISVILISSRRKPGLP